MVIRLKDVIIVGGGLGGLASALRLLHAGYQVTIYEKESSVGGRINQLKTKQGYTFDLTASILLLKQPLIELFNDLNLKLEDYLPLQELPTIYRVFYQHQVISVTRQISTCLMTLEQQTPKDSIKFLKFLAEGYDRLVMTNEQFLTKRFEQPSDFFNLQTILTGATLKPFQTSATYLKSFKFSEWLTQYLLFQSMYVGINPYQSPNIYTILPVGAQLYGISYLKEGLYTMIRVMEQLITAMGGKILTNTAVDKICVKDGRVTGIEVKAGYKAGYKTADIVLINTDVTYAHQVLLRESTFKPLTSSCSVFILYLGIRQRLTQLDVHNIYLGKVFDKNLQDAFVGNIPTQPSLYIYCPSRVDPSVAPNGCEAVSVTVRIPHLGQLSDFKKCDKLKIRTYIVKTLSKILNTPNLEELIEYESCLTPTQLRNCFNAYEGNAFGAQHNFMQTTYFRPHHQSKTINNLYYVGASTHPGTGITLVLKGAKLVVNEIMSNN